MKKILLVLYFLFALSQSVNAMVAGINTVQYLKNACGMKTSCIYPAGDFEEVSMSIQKKYKCSQYEKPIILMPSGVGENMPLALFISGDGGWTSFDHSICDKLVGNGIPVIGLDSQKFFWQEKQPKEVAMKLAQEIGYYMQLWNRKSFILIGYSFGACVVPFIAVNLPSDLKRDLKGVYCFSPDLTGDFEIHISDMMHLANKEKYNVPEGIKKIEVQNTVCIFGNEEDNKVRNEFSKRGIRVEILPGTHHYNNAFDDIARIIVKDFYK